MVVGFVFPDEDDDSGCKRAATRKKYLVAHSSEQANSIFDYVYVSGLTVTLWLRTCTWRITFMLSYEALFRHLSSALLRKVRFGQPIELAIQVC